MERKSRRRRKKNTAWIWAVVIAVCAGIIAYFGASMLKEEPAEEVSEPLLPEIIATPEPTPTPKPNIIAPDTSLYTARLEANREENTVDGELRLHYVNNALETLYSVKLHLTPNAMAPGSLMVTEVYLNDRGAYFTASGAELNIPLALELEQGESCELFIKYKLNISSAYGGGGGSWNLPGAIPCAMAYENGWLADVPLGDVAYSPAARYRVVVEGAKDADSSIEEKDSMYFVSEAAQGFDVVLKW